MNTSKPCRVCGVVKPMQEFSASKAYKSGYSNLCRECNKAKCAEYNTANKAARKRVVALYRALNREKAIAAGRAYYLANKEATAELNRLKYYADHEANKARLRAAYQDRKSGATQQRKLKLLEKIEADRQEALLAKQQDQRSAEEKHQDAKKAWLKANPVKSVAYVRKRAAQKQNAIPAWYSEFDDLFFVEAADKVRRLKAITGVVWAVDHIVPLNSAFVCGLHWHGNAQLLTRTENSIKNNKTWPQMA